MNQLAALEAFVRVAETGSFSQAARLLELSPSVVSKRVADLERAYRAQLFQRSTRSVALTAAGEALLQGAGQALAALEEARRALGGEVAEARGRLRIAAPTSFGSQILGPAVCAFRERHPGVTAELVLVDRGVNPIAEGFDLALDDSGRPPEACVSRPLPALRRVVVAAPAYLADSAPVRRPGDLARHACIQYSELESGAHWRFVDERGSAQDVRVSPVLASNNGRVMLDATRRGHGIALLPVFLAAASLASGELVTLLDGWRSPAIPLALVYARSAYRPQRARLLLEFLIQRFDTDPPPWERAAS